MGQFPRAPRGATHRDTTSATSMRRDAMETGSPRAFWRRTAHGSGSSPGIAPRVLALAPMDFVSSRKNAPQTSTPSVTSATSWGAEAARWTALLSATRESPARNSSCRTARSGRFAPHLMGHALARSHRRRNVGATTASLAPKARSSPANRALPRRACSLKTRTISSCRLVARPDKLTKAGVGFNQSRRAFPWSPAEFGRSPSSPGPVLPPVRRSSNLTDRSLATGDTADNRSRPDDSGSCDRGSRGAGGCPGTSCRHRSRRRRFRRRRSHR
jgi:hypothetical protein